ncbi:MAG: ABC transporter permease [Spirochaetales bacterium]|nr:ABC transporter permease [Spirochaetales bacterium]
MNVKRTWVVLSRDVVMGPRTMMALWLFVFPLIITFVVRLIFGGLVDPSPRLGIVDLGKSDIPAIAADFEDIEVTLFDSVELLKEKVEANNLDAGLVLQKGFDNAVRSGELPELQLFVGGDSKASTRVVLAVTAVNLIRGVAGSPAPVEVITTVLGDGPSVPIQDRLVPMLVLLAVALGGIFLPAAMLIQEKVSHTVDAVLSTPVQVGDFFLAKGALGFLLSFGTGVVALLVNGGFTVYVAGNLAVIAVGALMSVQLGLILGSTIKDLQTMFTVWKGGGIILFAPAVLFLFPGVPEWIAKLFPTYYFLGPLYEMTVNAASLAEVYIDLLIGVGISAVLLAVVVPLSRRMEMRLAIG